MERFLLTAGFLLGDGLRAGTSFVCGLLDSAKNWFFLLPLANAWTCCLHRCRTSGGIPSIVKYLRATTLSRILFVIALMCTAERILSCPPSCRNSSSIWRVRKGPKVAVLLVSESAAELLSLSAAACFGDWSGRIVHLGRHDAHTTCSSLVYSVMGMDSIGRLLSGREVHDDEHPASESWHALLHSVQVCLAGVFGKVHKSPIQHFGLPRTTSFLDADRLLLLVVFLLLPSS